MLLVLLYQIQQADAMQTFSFECPRLTQIRAWQLWSLCTKDYDIAKGRLESSLELISTLDQAYPSIVSLYRMCRVACFHCCANADCRSKASVCRTRCSKSSRPTAVRSNRRRGRQKRTTWIQTRVGKWRRGSSPYRSMNQPRSVLTYEASCL